MRAKNLTILIVSFVVLFCLHATADDCWSNWGEITSLRIHRANHVYCGLKDRSLLCGTKEFFFHLPGTNDSGKHYLAMLLSAQNAGKKIRVFMIDGNCRGGRTLIDGIRIQN